MVSNLLGFNMNFKLLGFSFNLVNLVVALCAIYFIIVVLGCSCSKISFMGAIHGVSNKIKSILQ